MLARCWANIGSTCLLGMCLAHMSTSLMGSGWWMSSARDAGISLQDVLVVSSPSCCTSLLILSRRSHLDILFPSSEGLVWPSYSNRASSNKRCITFNLIPLCYSQDVISDIKLYFFFGYPHTIYLLGKYKILV